MNELCEGEGSGNMALRSPPWPIRWVVVPLTERVGKEGVGLRDGEREKGVGGSHTHNMMMILKTL